MARFEIREFHFGNGVGFRFYDNGKIVAALHAVDAPGNFIVITSIGSENISSNLSFFRLTKKVTGEGRTPMQELLVRVIKWGKSKGCTTIVPIMNSVRLSQSGKRLLAREIKRGSIGGLGEILKVPAPLDLKKQQKQRRESSLRKKSVFAKLRSRFRRRK